jgi:hypothetical protein
VTSRAVRDSIVTGLVGVSSLLYGMKNHGFILELLPALFAHKITKYGSALTICRL